MKALAIVKYVFFVLGLGMLVGTFFLWSSTNKFVSTAAKANGTVVDLLESRSNDSITYKPLVQFEDQSGSAIQFASSVSSNPPSYAKGEQVEVLYNPTKPNDAKINAFSSLWLGAIILGILGGVFFLIGAGIMLYGVLKGRNDESLKLNGMPVQAEIQSVERNTAVSVNDQSPYIILTQWLNPITSELHIFKSNNIWFDPSTHIKQDKLTVFIDRNNPKKYYVDLSFLPKLAK